MSEKNIVSYTGEELDVMRGRGEDRTDWAALAKMKDEDIDCSDIPALTDEELATAVLVIPNRRKKITFNIDREVLDFFRKDGPGYQRRMNAVPKSFVVAHEQKRCSK